MLYPDRYYAGIGSRETPLVICKDMTYIAEHLRELYTLRSGHAGGADLAFEAGSEMNKQIFLPYDGFNGGKVDDVNFFTYSPEAMKLASFYHPAWKNCSFAAKRFHARNCHQVLGPDLKTPVEFVICYTERGLLKGGTAQAMRIAKDHDIPIFNLGKLTRNDVLYMLQGYIKNANDRTKTI